MIKAGLDQPPQLGLRPHMGILGRLLGSPRRPRGQLAVPVSALRWLPPHRQERQYRHGRGPAAKLLPLRASGILLGPRRLVPVARCGLVSMLARGLQVVLYAHMAYTGWDG